MFSPARRFRRILLQLSFAAMPFSIGAQATSSADSTVTPQNGHAKAIRTLRATPSTASVVVDGRLDESVWSSAQPATDFLQSQPKEGELATERTEIRFLFDDEALYVGARMFDRLGVRGVRPRLVRRDQFSEESDWITLVFDTFHDHLGRTRLSVNASGAKEDGYGPGGSNVDASWDPIWQAATTIDSLGWIAEMRIPFSQLRFSRDAEQTWGVQAIRFLARLNERTHYAFWRSNEAGGPSRFNHLEGLRIAEAPRRFEVLPYVVTRNSYVRPGNPNNPFTHKVFYDVRAGGDLKYLLTSNLTLNATVNPDFGQVEVDPAVINLSQFETFFPERRPFFIEGSGLFNFGSFSCYFCSNVSSLSLFYSRRIGRLPQAGSLATARASGGFADIPENTTILGAAKVTGRTKNGFSIGVLDALTAEGRARIETPDGRELDQIVEPRTNYFVGRLKKDFRGGNAVLGGIVTSTRRNMNDAGLLPLLPAHAEAAGPDFSLTFRNRTYSVIGSYALSSVGGDKRAITRLQNAPARYFQRPDREGSSGFLLSDSLDPRADNMRGVAGYTRIGKDAGDWLYEAAVNFRTPGFEVNDIAFNTRSDYVWNNANLARSWTKPTRYYRNMFALVGAQRQVNFDGDFTDGQFHLRDGAQFPNYWSANAFYIHRPEASDDRLLRGGPVVRRAANDFVNAYVTTDSRRKVVLETNPSYQRNTEGFDSYSVNLFFRLKPAPNISLSVGPNFSYGSNGAQYVTAYSDTTANAFYDRRYVLASIEQRTLSFDTRVQWTFTPNLSFELFMQSLVGSGDFFDFKEFAAPRTLEKRLYGTRGSTIDSTIATSGQVGRYTVDADGATGDSPATTFDNPDFIRRSLLGNAVLRWEYLPGSTIFLVWQQSRNASDVRGDFDFTRDYGQLFGTNPRNYFLLKVNYWFGM